MKLHEIIKTMESGKDSVIIEELFKYRKALKVYYNNYFSGGAILMVTAVFNACGYGIIVPEDEFNEAICTYLNDFDCSNEDNENYSEYETICANSIPLALL